MLSRRCTQSHRSLRLICTGLLVIACGGKITSDPDDGRNAEYFETDAGGAFSSGGNSTSETSSGGALGSGATGSVTFGDGGGDSTSGGSDSSGGAPDSSTGGTSGSTGSGGQQSELAAPWPLLYGHYDLYVLPQDLMCAAQGERMNFSLRAGEAGPEARVFRDFEWAGWKEVVVEDASRAGLLIHPGEESSLDGYVSSEGLFLPYGSEGFIVGATAGSAMLHTDCGDGLAEVPARLQITADTTQPVLRESFSTRVNFYPFTWTMFRFSEPLGFTGDTYPWGSFHSREIGESLVVMRDSYDEISAPGEFQSWPWGPVFGLAITAPEYRRGGSVWFELIGEEADDAGNPLVSDMPMLGVIDLGPLEARHEFDEEPPLLGFSAAEHVPPGPNQICETEGGCVVITQFPGNCDLEAHHIGSSMQQFSFRVGGPDAAGGQATGVRVRYRVLSMGDYGHDANFITFETGTTSSKMELSSVSGLTTPLDSWTHASAWTNMVIPDPLAPTNDLGIALTWDCYPGVQPHRAIVIEWVEATVN